MSATAASSATAGPAGVSSFVSAPRKARASNSRISVRGKDSQSDLTNSALNLSASTNANGNGNGNGTSMGSQNFQQELDSKRPGDISTVKADDDTEDDGSKSQVKNVAAEVRDFLRVNSNELNFLAEIPFPNGNTRWALFMFLCKTEASEAMLLRLNNRGVGNIKDGLGMVTFMPIQLCRISTNLAPRDPPRIMQATPQTAVAAATTPPIAPVQNTEQVPAEDRVQHTSSMESGGLPAGMLNGDLTAAAAAAINNARNASSVNQNEAAGEELDGARPPSPSYMIRPTSKANEGVANALRAAYQAGLITPNELEQNNVDGVVAHKDPSSASLNSLVRAGEPQDFVGSVPTRQSDESTASSGASDDGGDSMQDINQAPVQPAIPPPLAQPTAVFEDEGDHAIYESDPEPEEDVIDVNQRQTAKTGFETMFGRFGATVKSRVAVDSVVELVNASSEFSFDYVVLCIVASALACIGLVTDNAVIIVASMLVSPLMGPILGFTFGVTLVDYHMIRIGLFSELAGLLICIIVGFIGGLCAIPFCEEALPNEQMWSRSSGNAVLVGIAIALPSGVGVALSVLGNNTSSLVGVAISASLLPPAVNTGILLAMGCLANTRYLDLDNIDLNEAIAEGDEGDWQLVTLKTILAGAGWSFLLTLANIGCIWVAGILMFKLKEVVPLDHKSEFWTEDVPNTRAYNGVLRRNDPEARELRKKVFDVLNHQQSGTLGSGSAVNPNVTLNTLRAQSTRRNVFDEDFFRPDPSHDMTSPRSGSSRAHRQAHVPHVHFSKIGNWSARHLLRQRSPQLQKAHTSGNLEALAEDGFDLNGDTPLNQFSTTSEQPQSQTQTPSKRHFFSSRHHETE